MYWINIIGATGASLLFLALLFIPLEKAFPAKPGQKIFRREWILDLCYFLGQYLFWSGLVLLVLNYCNEAFDTLLDNHFRTIIRLQPQWLQAIEVLVLSDVLIYWGHRLQHQVNFLWRFHKIHHSTTHMDWLAAHREHPVDSVYTVGIINLPALIAGFDLDVISAIVAFRGIWAIYIHSNVRLPIGKLKWIIGAPELHHWHHDKERDRGNYANISPLMDILFGTYVCPDHEPDAFGITEELPGTYAGQMMEPFLSIKKLS